MKAFEHSIDIQAPAEVVWEILSNVTAWPEWLPTVSQVKPLGPGNMALGECFAIRQPRLPAATWRVVELAPPYSFAWEARSPGARTWANHRIVRTGADACTVVLSFAFGGGLAGLLGWLFAKQARANLARECVALKVAAESPPGPNNSSKPTPLRGAA